MRFIKNYNLSTLDKRLKDLALGLLAPEGHPDTPNRIQEMDYLKAKKLTQLLTTYALSFSLIITTSLILETDVT